MLGRAAKLHRPLAECVIRNEVAHIQKSKHTLVPNQIPCISTAAGAAGLSAIPESNAKQITQIWDTPAALRYYVVVFLVMSSGTSLKQWVQAQYHILGLDHKGKFIGKKPFKTRLIEAYDANNGGDVPKGSKQEIRQLVNR